MKKLLIQIDCKDELPETGDDYFTDKGKGFYNQSEWYLYENYDEPIWWYKEVDQRTYDIELLESYSKFLEKEGFTDIDWRAEEPFAIDEFLKHN